MEKTQTFAYAPLPMEISFDYKKTMIEAFTPYHRHDGYELYLLLDGNVHYYVEQSCYHISPGALLVVSPDEMHRTACIDTSPYERIFLNIRKTGISRLSSANTNLLQCFDSRKLGMDNLIHLSDTQFQDVKSMFETLGALYESENYGNDILFQAELAKLLVYTNVLHSKMKKSKRNIMPELIQSIMYDINCQITKPVTLEQLSEKYFLSGAYISRLFKQHTGLTLRSYILDRKIFHARQMLDEGYTISEACFQSGFSDYSNFIRSFTNVVGVSPGRYCKKAPNTNDNTI